MNIRKLAEGKKNLTRAQLLALVPNKVYDDGRTKQSFKDETDINKIIQRAEKSGTISHLTKYQGAYGDFADFDYFENLQKLTRGREIFDELPAELRNEFRGSPVKFFDYVNDPANKERLGELLPALAEPGRQIMSIKPAVADTPAEDELPSEAAEVAAEATIEPEAGS